MRKQQYCVQVKMANENGANNNENNNEINQSSSAGGIRAPKPMRFDNKNMDIIYKEWIQQFNWFSIATQLNKKPPEVQAATLMATIGTEAAIIFNTFNLTQEQQLDIEVIKAKFSAHFSILKITPHMKDMFSTYSNKKKVKLLMSS